MSKTLRISPDLALPANAQTSTLVVYGGKGMGKTTFGSVLVEELHRAGLRFSILDPLDVWWGLQHGATKDAPGLDVVILGGPHGDIPIEPTAGQVVADFVADESVSTVIVLRGADGSMWSAGERIRFVADYCARLYQRQGEARRPLMQVIDEAGRFVPQNPARGDVDIAKCVGAIEQLVEWGRNVGVGVTLITQRSARMNKSVSELADVMVAFRTVGPNSVSAIVDWFGEHVPKDRQRDLVEKLRTLPRGTALVVSPGWLEFEGVAAIRARETFDSSATPEGGRAVKAPSKATKPDLEKYRERMAETIAQAEASDPRALARELKAARETIRRLDRGGDAYRAPAPAPAVKPADVARLEKAVDRLLADGARLADTLAQRQQVVVTEAGALRAALQAAAHGTLHPVARLSTDRKGAAGPHALQTSGSHPTRDGGSSPAAPRVHPAREYEQRHRETLRAHHAARVSRDPVIEKNREALSTTHRRILDAVAYLNGIGIAQPSRIQVALFARMAPSGGYTKNQFGALRSSGLIDYPADGRVVLTHDGVILATGADVPATPDEMQRDVLAKLDGGQAKLLRVLIAAYPEALDKAECASRAGMAADGGYTKNQFGRLRTLGLITYPTAGTAKASPVLFLEGVA